ncbi:MAG: hypothetical protein A2293_07650 [Elusimicrobia bacterium RIFOXYB2_FULL_49_7]|nr:MAG: hypothetical protein A2293_07650 [Elusimicrobia bacterium RIFOXYB2_FULL_49_7]
MKYIINIEKVNDSTYRAYCPVIKELQATGTCVNSALARLQQDFICFIHDPDAEMEIKMHEESSAAPQEGN